MGRGPGRKVVEMAIHRDDDAKPNELLRTIDEEAFSGAEFVPTLAGAMQQMAPEERTPLGDLVLDITARSEQSRGWIVDAINHKLLCRVTGMASVNDELDAALAVLAVQPPEERAATIQAIREQILTLDGFELEAAARDPREVPPAAAKSNLSVVTPRSTVIVVDNGDGDIDVVGFVRY